MGTFLSPSTARWDVTRPTRNNLSPKHWYPKSWLRVCFVFAQGLLLKSFLCPGSARGMIWVCFGFALGQPLRSVLRKKVWSRPVYFLTACIFQIHIGRHVIFQQQFNNLLLNSGSAFHVSSESAWGRLWVRPSRHERTHKAGGSDRGLLFGRGSVWYRSLYPNISLSYS